MNKHRAKRPLQQKNGYLCPHKQQAQMTLDKRKALVVLSGGQDSTTCLFWAKRRFEHVCAITYAYGQSHEAEVDMARWIAAEAGVEHEVVDARYIARLSSGCSLTDPSVPMDSAPETRPQADGVEWGQSHIINTFVPGRNLFFLAMAAVRARELGIMNIVTGVSQTDYSGYPDCRDTFIRTLNAALNLGMEEQFVIHTPLMWLDKAETWALADELGVLDLVRTRTLTCYQGLPADGCGQCPACKLRKKGLEQYLSWKGAKKA